PEGRGRRLRRRDEPGVRRPPVKLRPLPAAHVARRVAEMLVARRAAQERPIVLENLTTITAREHQKIAPALTTNLARVIVLANLTTIVRERIIVLELTTDPARVIIVLANLTTIARERIIVLEHRRTIAR